MKQINDINEFLNEYNFLHDDNITSINYNVENSILEITLNVFETEKKLKLIFDNVKKINIKDIDQTDYLNDIYFKIINFENKDLFCFADEISNPNIYVLANNVSYMEL